MEELTAHETEQARLEVTRFLNEARTTIEAEMRSRKLTVNNCILSYVRNSTGTEFFRLFNIDTDPDGAVKKMSIVLDEEGLEVFREYIKQKPDGLIRVFAIILKKDSVMCARIGVSFTGKPLN